MCVMEPNGQTMAKKDRARIDYMPGSAAFEALGIAGAMFPDMRPQALIDKLVILKASGNASAFAYSPNVVKNAILG